MTRNLEAALLAIIVSLAAACPVTAQEVGDGALMDGLEIHGVVTEPGPNGTAIPVAAAQIAVTEFRLIDKTVTPTVFATLTTDDRGVYRVRPLRLGNFILDVRKSGFPLGSAYVTLSRDKAAVESDFSLVRLGTLTGRVVDADGKPVAGLRVGVNSVGSNMLSVNSGMTNAEGVFRVEDMSPAKYVVQVGMKYTTISTQPYSEANRKTVDRDIELSYWPGGAPNAEGATPVVVSPGGSADVGTIQVARTNYYRAHVRVNADGCELRESWRLQTLADTPYLYGGPSLSIPCEKAMKDGFVVLNLKPGGYWFSLTPGLSSNGDLTRYGLERVEIGRENVEVHMDMVRTAELSGRIVTLDGAKPVPVKGTTIGMQPLILDLASARAKELQPDGQFKLRMAWNRGRLQVRLAGSEHYVKQIRLNGQILNDNLIALPPGSTGQLEVIVDDGAPSISGSVMNGDRPTQALVFMTIWPVAPTLFGESMPSRARLTLLGSERPSSTFTAAGLTPGNYRIFAIPREAIRRLDEPGMVERVATQGQKLVLERGGSQSIVVKLIDLSRF